MPSSSFTDMPSWVARNAAQRGELQFFALPVDGSFNALPTFSVRVLRGRQEIAVYKCNMLRDGDSAVFSPLVVTWGAGGNPGGGLSREIVDHCVFCACGYSRAVFPEISDVIVTSGNLTEERAGLPFFQALQWQIVTESGARDAPLRQVAVRLKKAASAFLDTKNGAAEDISFAVLRCAAQP